ncbi:MAG: oxidoreductase, partial [Gemmatimonadetes bacterium]|nr:oxidoreductase [Gemmatimonadota bacterium]
MTAATTLTRDAPSRTRPRLGFLGVGWIGRHRLGAIAESGAAEIVAIADASESALRDARAHVPSCDVASSIDELLDARLDGIVIATPSAMHAEQAIAALERGVAVFCQKPLARSARETRRVVEAARAADRLLGVDLSYRFTEGMRRIRQLARGGELGTIYAVDLVFHNAYGPDKPWFYDPRLSGGGCVIDLGIHLVDLVLWTLDFPRVLGATSRLFSHGEPLRDTRSQVEDFAEARLDLHGGTAARLACSWNLSAGRDAVIEVSFYGTAGGAAMRNVEGSFFDFRAERFRGTAREILSEPPDAWSGRAAVEWARQLGRGGRFDPAVEHL